MVITQDRKSPPQIDLSTLEFSPALSTNISSDLEIRLPSLSDVVEDETFFMLSAIARLGAARALTERILIDPILLNRHIAPELQDLGYRRSSDNPQVLKHPSTVQDGWIMELSDGQSLWGASYIVGGHIEGRVSKDLFYAVEQSKARISDKFFALFKHPDLHMYDELAIRTTEPFQSIFKEVKNFRDAQAYVAAHSEDLPDIKAALPVYWNRPTHMRVD